MSNPPTCAAPLPVSESPKSALPAHSCDTHFHIFDAPSQQVSMRSYTAPYAPLSEYKLLQRKLGFERSVIVQPSVYGADNQTTLMTCQADPNMRAVVVIDSEISKKELKNFTDLGVVGCRVNMLFQSGVNIHDIRALAHKIADFGWHIQILADISELEDLSPFLRDMPVPVMFDHMGHISADKAITNKAFQSFCKYLADGQIWAKLSAAYRLSCLGDGRFDDVEHIVQALVKANPNQLVWGTDWPHPQINGVMPNDTQLVNAFLDWIPVKFQQTIFADNAAHFYQFEKATS